MTKVEPFVSYFKDSLFDPNKCSSSEDELENKTKGEILKMYIAEVHPEHAALASQHPMKQPA